MSWVSLPMFRPWAILLLLQTDVGFGHGPPKSCIQKSTRWTWEVATGWIFFWCRKFFYTIPEKHKLPNVSISYPIMNHGNSATNCYKFKVHKRSSCKVVQIWNGVPTVTAEDSQPTICNLLPWWPRSMPLSSNLEMFWLGAQTYSIFGGTSWRNP